MSDISAYLKRASERTGFQRNFYVERNLPTEPSNVVAIPFYGDMRSTFILSSYLLKSYKLACPDKYFVLCSWPGLHGMFPYVDEYWSINDESVTKLLATDANNFYNTSNMATEITRNLVEVLSVTTARDLSKFYDLGFTQKYWETFGGIQRFLPEVPSATQLSADFTTQIGRRQGKKIIIYPAKKLRSWQSGCTVQLPISKEFWIALTDRLIQQGFDPVVYQNWFTYDISPDLAEKCIYLVPRSIADVLAAMRYVGCVLDVHSGISRLALAARCPFMAITERRSFIEDKDYELDDLSCKNMPHQYIFSFSTMLMTGGPTEWDVSVLDSILKRLEAFFPLTKTDDLPSTKESFETVSYEDVRQRKARRLGVAFINASKQR